MAFVSRSERDTSVPAPRSTTDKVGPGSYSLLSARTFIPSAAPFASNTKRVVGASSSCSTSSSHEQQKASSASIPASLAASSSGRQAADASSAAHTGALQTCRRSTKSSSFASSTQRFSASKEILAKPGPGAYQTSPKWSSSSHATASQHREAASKKVAELLGTATAAIASVAVAGVQPAGKSSSKAAEVPVLTPPSIPAKHQSYGYEKGPGRLLVMQPPPQPGGTPDETAATSQAASSSSVHSTAKGTAWAASRTDRWGAQRQQHSPRQQRHAQQQQRQQQQDLPGPGTYQADSCATRFRMLPDGRLVPCHVSNRGSFSAAGSAAFLSRVARPHQTEPDPDRNTPGPGAYLQLRPHSAPQFAAASVMPTHRSPQQLFGRGPGRECAIGGLPGVSHAPSVAPGPGAYDLSASGVMTKKVRNSAACLPRGAAAGSAPCTSVVATAHADQDTSQSAGGFGSTSSRFGDANSHSPGPGKYTADQTASMAADVARKAAAASRRGVFGSAADRFSSTSGSPTNSPAAAAVLGGSGACSALGPGAYDVDRGVAKHVAAAAARPSPGFVSCSQRFTPAAAPVAAPDYSSWDGEPESLRGDAARLGPGAYVKLDDWGGKAAGQGSRSGSRASSNRHPAYHSAPFGSEAARSSPVLAAAAAAQKGATPGPGAYNKAALDMRHVFRPLSVPGSGAGFSTGSKRFGSSTSESPGPGAYTADTANSCSLVRPSYNVTLDC